MTSPEERTEEDSSQPSDPEPEPTPTIPGITVTEGEVDALDSVLTTVSLISGDTFEGELESSGDKDWVRIELTAGSAYTFDLEGEDTDAGTLSDPFLVLRNASGGFVVQDDDSGEKLNAQIVFTPSSSGTYYLEARNFDGETGTYSLRTFPEERTSDVGGSGGGDGGGGDTDGGGDGGGGDGSGGDTGGSGTIISGITVSEGDTDEPGFLVADATLISGDTFIGEIDDSLDSDNVAINLSAGTQYTFDLEGSATGAGTITDPILRLRNIIGDTIVTDAGSGVGLNARIVFTPTESGTYYLSAAGRNGAEGTYTLTTTPNERLDTERGISDPPGDIVPGVAVFEGEDAASDRSTAYAVISGDSFAGSLGSSSDVDYVAIELTAGTVYGFILEGFNSGRGDTLRDPILVLRDADGNFIAQHEHSIFAIAQLEFQPTESGTYYLSVRTESGFSGTYTLSTSPDQRTAQDPLPNSGSEPAPIIDGIDVEEEGRRARVDGNAGQPYFR